MCLFIKPPTNMTASQSGSNIASINQEKQLQEAKLSFKADALLMKKAFVIVLSR